MRYAILASLMIFGAGCTTLPSDAAICSGTVQMRKDHARALLQDGGEISQRTGERLLTGIKAGCAE